MARKNREELNEEVQEVETDVVDSEAVVDEKKTKAEAKKKLRNEAKARVRSFMKEDGVAPELVADLILLIGDGSRASAGPRIASINGVLRDAFIEKGSITEMDLFLQFKIGRPEMTTKVRIFLKTPNPEDRIWVKFNEDTETYELISQGKETPEGWDGFVPAEQNIL